jgi:hypothetical protein
MGAATMPTAAVLPPRRFRKVEGSTLSNYVWGRTVPDVDELRRVLEPHTQADVTQTYQRFRETMRSQDLGQFVAYLVDQGLLPQSAAPNVEAELRAGANEPTIVETCLSLPDRQTLRTSLVNGEGKKVIDSTDAGKRFVASGKDESLALYDFGIKEVVSAVRAGSEGLKQIRHNGRDELVVFVRLDVLGWYYVVEVDEASVEGR